MSFQMSIAIWVTYRTHYGISNLYWYLNDLQNWIWEFKSWLLFEWLTELGDFNSQLLFEWLKNWLWNFKYHCYLNDLQTDYGISNLEAIWVTYRTMRLEVSIGIWMTYRTDFGISNIDCYLNDFPGSSRPWPGSRAVLLLSSHCDELLAVPVQPCKGSNAAGFVLSRPLAAPAAPHASSRRNTACTESQPNRNPAVFAQPPDAAPQPGRDSERGWYWPWVHYIQGTDTDPESPLNLRGLTLTLSPTTSKGIVTDPESQYIQGYWYW
jgi:hypothetical protein